MKVKGAQTGVVTDFDGNFSLDAPANSVLIISYVGYNDREVAVNSRAIIDKIQLESNTKTLDQLVVVGYGTQQRTQLTGSVATIGSEKIEIAPAPTLDAAIGGIVVRSFGDSGIDLRGIVKTRTVEENFSACSDIRRAIKAAVDADPDVEFAYPHMQIVETESRKATEGKTLEGSIQKTKTTESGSPN